MQAVQRALDFVELARKAANSWPDLKPWLNATDIQALVKKVGLARGGGFWDGWGRA